MVSLKPNYRRTLGLKFYLWEMVVTELRAPKLNPWSRGSSASCSIIRRHGGHIRKNRVGRVKVIFKKMTKLYNIAKKA
jgi:hypothetical protein